MFAHMSCILSFVRALKVAVTDMSINQTSCVTAREAMNQVLQRLNFKPFQVH